MATKTITTPAGIARYPHLNRPDLKFDDVGVFKVNLEMSNEDAESFIAKIDELFTDFVSEKKRELKKDKLKMHAFPWEENDGMTQLKLKVKAIGKTKAGEEYSRKPKIFGADGKPLEANIGGGSKIKVAVVPYFWYTASLGAGITLQPKAVQVIDLVTWGDGASAEAYGFEVSAAANRMLEIDTALAVAKVHATHARRATIHDEPRKTGTDDEEVSW